MITATYDSCFLLWTEMRVWVGWKLVVLVGDVANGFLIVRWASAAVRIGSDSAIDAFLETHAGATGSLTGLDSDPCCCVR